MKCRGTEPESAKHGLPVKPRRGAPLGDRGTVYKNRKAGPGHVLPVEVWLQLAIPFLIGAIPKSFLLAFLDQPPTGRSAMVPDRRSFPWPQGPCTMSSLGNALRLPVNAQLTFRLA